ncbi:uncharacterized protein PgNI_02689, partial [Pyricularia grisea]|uniref:Uncharacterized protein n=1 Tax=Pyricularia grisea TaxID=148305 RepID=A0A6P8BBD2_PYRGI
ATQASTAPIAAIATQTYHTIKPRQCGGIATQTPTHFWACNRGTTNIAFVTISKILSSKKKYLTPDELCVANIEDRLLAWTKKYPSSSINQIREQVERLYQNTPKISAQLAKKLQSATSLETFQREHHFNVLCFQTSEPSILHCNTSPASPQKCLLESPYTVP